jgi:hypothetical protein
MLNRPCKLLYKKSRSQKQIKESLKLSETKLVTLLSSFLYLIKVKHFEAMCIFEFYKLILKLTGKDVSVTKTMYKTMYSVTKTMCLYNRV